MQVLDELSWEVLNATADDCENLEQIYRQVCYEVLQEDDANRGSSYLYRPVKKVRLLSEIADRIRLLVEQRLLTIVMDEEGRPWHDLNDLSYVWRAWLRMTPQGRSVWESSDHAVEQE